MRFLGGWLASAISASPSASAGAGASERSRFLPVLLAERALLTARSASRPIFSREACMPQYRSDHVPCLNVSVCSCWRL